MNREQMLKNLQAIESLESKFNRKLTQKEIDLYLDGGLNALLGECSMTERDFATMKRCVKLITSGFTESEEKYDSELDDENFDALEVFKSLVNDLEAIQEKKKKQEETKVKKEIHYNKGPMYKAEEDKDLNERFTPQAQKEANECSITPNKEDDLMLPEFLEKLIEGEVVNLTEEQREQAFDYFRTHYNNYTISSINGNTVVILSEPI